MAETSTIEWTDATWNPITGCTLVSEGCRHCYAARLAATRLKHLPSRAGLARVNAAGEAKFTGEVRLNEDWLDQPLRWRRPRRIFVCAHGDLFHEAVADEWIDRVFAVMALAPRHTFQVLTKRPERARGYLSRPDVSVRVGLEALGMTLEAHAQDPRSTVGAEVVIKATDINPGGLQNWPLPNVWLGTSVEDQATADARIPHLLAAPAAVRFVSAEPLLGPVDLEAMPFADGDARHHWSALTGQALMLAESTTGGPNFVCRINTPIKPRLDWVIVGGESGPGARPMHPDWARRMRDDCSATSVPFFFKQWGEWAPISEIGESGELYRPASERDPEASRRCRFSNLVMHADGAIFDRNPAGAYHRFTSADTFAAGAKAMLMFEIGKQGAGRALDGREHNEMPGEGSA